MLSHQCVESHKAQTLKWRMYRNHEHENLEKALLNGLGTFKLGLHGCWHHLSSTHSYNAPATACRFALIFCATVMSHQMAAAACL